MASKILSDDALNALINEVESLPEEQLKELAAEAFKRQAEEIERRKKYNSSKTPEQVAKQREYQKLNNAKKRERQALIMKKAKEMGLI